MSLRPVSCDCDAAIRPVVCGPFMGVILGRPMAPLIPDEHLPAGLIDGPRFAPGGDGPENPPEGPSDGPGESPEGPAESPEGPPQDDGGGDWGPQIPPQDPGSGNPDNPSTPIIVVPR